ncbi:MAG TPA: tetratricopeptide repeat protein [Chroococcales cyanobacterium]
MRSRSLLNPASPKLHSVFLSLFVAVALPLPANRYIPELDLPKASVYVNRGDTLYDQGKLDEAIAAYRKAIKINAQDSWVFGILGEALGDRGKLDEAIAAYQKAIQLNPYFASVYNNLGNGLYAQGKLDEAIATYQKAIQLNPYFAYAYSNLGNALSDRGKLDEAIVAFRNSIQLDPKNAIIYNNLGNALQQQGKLKEAIQEFKQAIRLDPSLSSPPLNLNEAQRRLAFRQNPHLSLAPERLPSRNDDHLVSLKRSVVRIIRNSSSDWHIGTGWVVRREGNKAWIVTNRHVVTGDKNPPLENQKIEVEFYSDPLPGQFRKRQPARITRTTSVDDPLDIALLEVRNIPQDIQPLPISSTDISPSTSIRTIGNPHTTGDWTVATGEVTKKTDQELQLSALSASGNSGAPVLDRSDRVTGVVWGRRSQSVDRSGPALAFPIQIVAQQLQSWGIRLSVR